MGKSPPLFRAALGVAGVALFVLLAFLLFGTPGSPRSAPAAPSLTPPRPSVVPTVARQTITPALATVAITATAIVTPTSVATKPTPTATRTFVATLVPTSTLPITAGWKIYENREHGFRIKYPPQFTFSALQPSGPEILYDMAFFRGADGAKYEPGVSPLIGLAIFNNPRRLLVEEWLKAHLLASPGSDQYSVQFESYQIVRTMNIAGVQAARLSVTSAANGIKSNLILLPVPNEARMIYMYFHIDPPTIEPLFEAMALTLERTR